MSTAALLCLVIAITDGDTLTTRCGEPGAFERITVRISAIDAPEKRQAFGQVSRQHLGKLCFEHVATITPRTHDKYGRTVGDVECQGLDVATEQVRSGMAWFYVKYGKGYEHLRGLEAEAREMRLGLWMQEAVAPWEWRSNNKRPVIPTMQKGNPKSGIPPDLFRYTACVLKQKEVSAS